MRYDSKDIEDDFVLNWYFIQNDWTRIISKKSFAYWQNVKTIIFPEELFNSEYWKYSSILLKMKKPTYFLALRLRSISRGFLFTYPFFTLISFRCPFMLCGFLIWKIRAALQIISSPCVYTYANHIHKREKCNLQAENQFRYAFIIFSPSWNNNGAKLPSSTVGICTYFLGFFLFIEFYLINQNWQFHLN